MALQEGNFVFRIAEFLMGGTQNFWSLMGAKSDGGTCEKKSDQSQNCPHNAKLGLFCYFKHEIQLFKGTFELKSSQM